MFWDFGLAIDFVQNLNKFPLLEEAIIQFEDKGSTKTKNQEKINENIASIIIKNINRLKNLKYFDFWPSTSEGKVINLGLKIPIYKYIRVEI